MKYFIDVTLTAIGIGFLIGFTKFTREEAILWCILCNLIYLKYRNFNQEGLE